MSDIQPPLKKQKIGLNDALPELSPWKSNHHNGSTKEGVLMPNLLWKQFYHKKVIPDNCSSKKSLVIPNFFDDRSLKNTVIENSKYPIVDIPKCIIHSAGENSSASLYITSPYKQVATNEINIHQVGCNGDGPVLVSKILPKWNNFHSPLNNDNDRKQTSISVHSYNETEAAVNSVLSINEFDNAHGQCLNDNISNGFHESFINKNNDDIYGMQIYNDGFSKLSDSNIYSPNESELATYQEVPLSKLFPCSNIDKVVNCDDNLDVRLNFDSTKNTSLCLANSKLLSDIKDSCNSHLNDSQSQLVNESNLDCKLSNNYLNPKDNPQNNSLDKSELTIADSDSYIDISPDNLKKSCINPNLVGAVSSITKFIEDSEFLQKVNDAAEFDMKNHMVSLSKYDILSRKLVLLLHAFSCLITCILPNCSVIKRLWQHMVACCDKTCSVTMCKSSCQILCHFSDCQTDSCAVCSRLRTPQIRANLSKSVQNECKQNNANSQTSQPTKSNHWTPYVTRSSNLKQDDTENKNFITENLVINRNMKPIKEKIWNKEDLEHILGPLLDMLFHCKKEIEPFMRPVDPDLDGCIDYFDIIKKPMDFSTLLFNINKGFYKEPWAVLDDIYLIFSNAWLYNKRFSFYHKYACKLADIFEANVDKIMQNFGFCCGQRYEFTPLPKYCDSQSWCVIPVMADYYSYKDQYSFCEKCFTENRVPTVSIFKDLNSEPLIVLKELFIKKKNLDRKSERFVRCNYCGRKNHVICVQFLEDVHTSYTCDYCVKKGQVCCKQIRYRAKDIAETKLSAFIERRVHAYLARKKQLSQSTRIYVRQIASSRSITEVRPRFLEHFPDMPSGFPYTSKALFVFQEKGDVDVCFFGMHTQEYGSDAPQPNKRRVYLAYLDSIQYFEPAAYRTAVYHEILLAYMQYIKSLGFLALHVWSCPPSEGDDYIFNCHPPKQKIPKTKRLHEWYCRLLEKAEKENIISRYSDILSYAVINELKSAIDMPYFEGDFWPTSLEDNIKILEKTDTSGEKTSGVKSNQSKGSKPKKGQKQQGKGKKMMNPIHGDALVDKIYSTLGKYREMFFVIEFFNNANNIIVNQPVLKDPDPLIINDLMNERSTFLIVAREKQAEFSTMRRAKHSTLVMLHEIMMRIGDGATCSVEIGPTCILCSKSCQKKYFQCVQICKSWTCCLSCYESVGHDHETKVHEIQYESQKSDPSNPKSQTAVENLEHAIQCAGCIESVCQKFKAAVAHVVACCEDKSQCSCCHTVARLSLLHARKCNIPLSDSCPVIFCNEARSKLRLQTQHQRQFDSRLAQRRTMAMLGPQVDEDDDVDSIRGNNWDRIGRG